MIEVSRGNLLETDAEAVVNTVNTVGVMGKGIALQFKKAYPDNFEAYQRACEAGEVVPGRMLVFERRSLTNPRYIINFPTKRHWRGKSQLADIEAGLDALVAEVKARGIGSVAVPPLGCGHGGLAWHDVRPRMEAAFAEAPDVEWMLFEPAGAPAPEAMPNRTRPPRMTQGRAAVIGLIDRYLVPGFDYPVSLLEIQKLVYFLVSAGEPMPRVEFRKLHYGPYADAIPHVLDRMDGHFLTGYGDGDNRPDTEIRLLPGAARAATRYLEKYPKTRARFERVSELIEGFETPFGMELLATVHWVARYEDARTEAAALSAVRAWSPRKASLLEPAHVAAAMTRLREAGWLDDADHPGERRESAGSH